MSFSQQSTAWQPELLSVHITLGTHMNTGSVSGFVYTFILDKNLLHMDRTAG